MPCTGQERPVSCGSPQPTQEQRDAGLKLSLFATSTGPIALGSCVQARQVHDGPCGPCAWYQCVLGPDGQPTLWCDPSLDALALPREGSPPSTGGYSCHTQWQHIGWTNNNHKLEPNAPARDPWTRWSYYAGYDAAMCPKPLKNADGKKH